MNLKYDIKNYKIEDTIKNSNKIIKDNKKPPQEFNLKFTT